MIYLSLGSNLGNRMKYLLDALHLISQDIGDICECSQVYETEAWGKKDQPDFLNLAIGVKTRLNPVDLLESILKIEVQLGRERIVKWGERCIDIDILFYENEIIALAPRLVVPHPLLIFRKFVLLPLVEIAPNYIHPQFKKSIQEILLTIEDESIITPIGNISI
ncbi:MAG: 2-amino-4-hydroxy-6-hydroxymethyldihydropteridine diphosphokinase [Pedobacter sp.]|nr:MAG: 2-amino-4-hydroxy-6-hydroxymethyldihydropteridine diphosphokinase [Pedobacter sp.]